MTTPGVIFRVKVGTSYSTRLLTACQIVGHRLHFVFELEGEYNINYSVTGVDCIVSLTCLA